MCARAGVASGGKLKVRKWLSGLLRASLLSGTVARGVSVHDLVRDVMIARAGALTGLSQRQRARRIQVIFQDPTSALNRRLRIGSALELTLLSTPLLKLKFI